MSGPTVISLCLGDLLVVQRKYSTNKECNMQTEMSLCLFVEREVDSRTETAEQSEQIWHQVHFIVFH